jgi:Zn-dependent peptidase ImmA (M78 family)
VRPGYRLRALESKRDAISQGTDVAGQERQRLGLGNQPIRNPLELLEQQGVRIGPVAPLEQDGVDGLYFESDALGACVGVYVRQSDLTGARAAFTAAHEYAHWLLQDIAAEFFTLQQTDDLLEVRANAFAAAFLMPEDGLRRYFADAGLLVGTSAIGHLSPGDVIRAMDHFGVSRRALLYRLINLNLIRQALADELATFPVETTARALQIRFATRGNAGTRLPQLAVHAWRLGHISASRAADLCDMDLASFKDWTHEIGEEQDPYDGLPLVGASAGA